MQNNLWHAEQRRKQLRISNWLYSRASTFLRLSRIEGWPEMPKRRNMLDRRRDVAPTGDARATPNGIAIRFGVRMQDELFGRV